MKTRNFSVLVIAIVLSLVFVPAVVAQEQGVPGVAAPLGGLQPTIQFTLPSLSVETGGSLSIGGTGARPDMPVEVAVVPAGNFRGEALWSQSIQPDAQGNFQLDVPTTDLTAGAYIIRSAQINPNTGGFIQYWYETVTVGSTGQLAQAQQAVPGLAAPVTGLQQPTIQFTLPSLSVESGGSLSISGTGARPDMPVEVAVVPAGNFRGEALWSQAIQPDAQGSFELDVATTDLTAGNYIIRSAQINPNTGGFIQYWYETVTIGAGAQGATVDQPLQETMPQEDTAPQLEVMPGETAPEDASPALEAAPEEQAPAGDSTQY